MTLTRTRSIPFAQALSVIHVARDHKKLCKNSACEVNLYWLKKVAEYFMMKSWPEEQEELRPMINETDWM